MINFPYIIGGNSGGSVTFDSRGMFQYPAEIVIPNTVTYINNSEGAFSGHSEIKKITFEQGSVISYVKQSAFQNCTGLEEIHFQSLGSIYVGGFTGCTSLKEFVLPASVTELNGNVFKGCSSMKRFVFNSIPTCGYYTVTGSSHIFYDCTALEDVVLPNGWTKNLLLSDNSSSFTKKLTHDSMVAMIAALKDYSEGTAHTLTLGATNLARLSEDEKAVATAKNWTLA